VLAVRTLIDHLFDLPALPTVPRREGRLLRPRPPAAPAPWRRAPRLLGSRPTESRPGIPTAAALSRAPRHARRARRLRSGDAAPFGRPAGREARAVARAADPVRGDGPL